jgi:hypothetical protein
METIKEKVGKMPESELLILQRMKKKHFIRTIEDEDWLTEIYLELERRKGNQNDRN